MNNAHRDWICGLSLAPGGQALLSGCRNGTVKLWGVETCQSLGELKAHTSQINAITTNQTHVFTASKYGPGQADGHVTGGLAYWGCRLICDIRQLLQLIVHGSCFFLL